MLDEATITQKMNQLLAELRANPDWKIDEKISSKVISKHWNGYCKTQE